MRVKIEKELIDNLLKGRIDAQEQIIALRSDGERMYRDLQVLTERLRTEIEHHTLANNALVQLKPYVDPDVYDSITKLYFESDRQKAKPV